MSTPTKSTSLQAYRLILYRRPLHPELFKIKARRTIEQDGYDFEAWLMPGSHAMRFQRGIHSVTELTSDVDKGIPARHLITEFPCAGEREHEEEIGNGLNFVATVQTEQLPESIYKATYDELLEFGRENDALAHEWIDEDQGKSASILDLQRYRNEVHAQGYHLRSQGGLVLRTHSIFELTADKRA